MNDEERVPGEPRHSETTPDAPLLGEVTPGDAIALDAATPDAGALHEPNSTPGEWPNRTIEWQRVSNSYAWVDLALNLIWVFAAIVVFVVMIVTPGDNAPLPLLILMPIAIVVLLMFALLAFRRVRAIGYILREDDLLFRRGIMFERIIAVPYGRLQLVDVTRGPLLRALGLATLKFVTASAATGVQLPGLRVEDAEELRDRLVALAESRRSGL